MSVYRDFYVIYGFEVEFSMWSDMMDVAMAMSDWDFEEELQEWFIVDGMSGQYAYFGQELFHITEHGESERKEIDIPDEEMKHKLMKKYMELVGDEPEKEFKIIAFDHYH